MLDSHSHDHDVREGLARNISRRGNLIPTAAMVFLIGFSFSIAGAGAWHTYTDASYVSGLAVSGEDLWGGTDGGVLKWDLVSETYIKYTATEGLADQRVKDVMIDDSGNLWFGTVEGVQRFDGSSWTTYNTSNSPLPNDTVFSLAQDQDGTLWFGTAYGCASFDGVDWQVFTDLGGGATNVAVRGIDVDSQNRIWTANNPDSYGDPGGVSVYDGISWTRHNPDPSDIGQYFLSLAVDDNDNVWAGSWTNWAFMYGGSSWTHFDSGNSALVGTQIECVEIENGTVVWIGTHAPNPTPTTGGVARFDGSHWTSYTPANSGLPDRYIYAIAAGEGTVYFGTGSTGCASFDGLAWGYYETSNEPHTNWITSIEEGSLGLDDICLYFATDHYGIAVLDRQTWSSYTSYNSDLGDDYVNDVHVAGGVLWAACQFTGAWTFDGLGWENYSSSAGDLLGDIILSADSDSHGDIWLGTSGWDGPMGQDGAVSRFNGSSWTHYYLENSGLIDDDGLEVAVDATDMIWIGTEEGVSKFDGVSTWTSYHTGNSGLIENHVQAIAFDSQNAKWFATRGGVSQLAGATWTSYTTADGLPSNVIRDIAVADDDLIWVATDAGAARLEHDRGWVAYPQGEGLGDNNLTAIGVGSQGPVWFGTRRSGISSYDEAGAGIESPDSPCSLAGQGVLVSPNPFRTSVVISYALPGQSAMHVSIYDTAGRLVRQLRSGAGRSICWDGRTSGREPAARGVYFYRIDGGDVGLGGKLLLLR